MSSPSNAMAVGPFPVLKVPNLCPSLARKLLTVASGKFVTQMLDPSKAAAHGACPTANVVVVSAGYHLRTAIWLGLIWDRAGEEHSSTIPNHRAPTFNIGAASNLVICGSPCLVDPRKNPRGSP